MYLLTAREQYIMMWIICTVAVTLHGGTTFITWRLRRTFWGECQRDQRRFWGHQECFGYDPAPGPTFVASFIEYKQKKNFPQRLFSSDDDVNLNLLENNQKMNNSKEIFLFVLSFLFIDLIIYIYIYMYVCVCVSAAFPRVGISD